MCVITVVMDSGLWQICTEQCSGSTCTLHLDHYTDKPQQVYASSYAHQLCLLHHLGACKPSQACTCLQIPMFLEVQLASQR